MKYIGKLGSGEETNETIPDFCSIKQMSSFDLVHLFLYAFFLPTFPFFFILMLLVVDLINENYGFWSIYEAFREMQCDEDNE